MLIGNYDDFYISVKCSFCVKTQSVLVSYDTGWCHKAQHQKSIYIVPLLKSSPSIDLYVVSPLLHG
jgi:hypothetical protein